MVRGKYGGKTKPLIVQRFSDISVFEFLHFVSVQGARPCSEQPHEEVKHLSLQAGNQPLIVAKTMEGVHVEISLGLILCEFPH